MKVAVVTRCLPQTNDRTMTVVSAVLTIASWPDNTVGTPEDTRLITLGCKHVESFQAKFPEFKTAKWEIWITETDDTAKTPVLAWTNRPLGD